jgi:hypothetical protein
VYVRRSCERDNCLKGGKRVRERSCGIDDMLKGGKRVREKILRTR